MSEMVERLAKLLWWKFEGSTPERAEEVWQQPEEVRGAERDEMRDIVRTALAIMHEPTSAMLDAARNAPLPMVYLDSAKARENLDIKAKWQAMIDTALSPECPASVYTVASTPLYDAKLEEF